MGMLNLQIIVSNKTLLLKINVNIGNKNDFHRILCEIKEPQITVFRQTEFILFSAGCTNVFL